MSPKRKQDDTGYLAEKPAEKRHLLRAVTGPGVENLVEVFLYKEGTQPERVLLPMEEARPELINKLQADLPDLPRLLVAEGMGAVDIRLEDQTGGQVKNGLLLLEGPSGAVLVDLDPITRRFRRGDLEPGDYTVRAASGQFGRGEFAITVRAGDVTRAIVTLDGKPAEGTTNLRIKVSAAEGKQVMVQLTDTISGMLVRKERSKVSDGFIDVTKVPLGMYHGDLIDDAGATGCFDIDAGDHGILSHLGAINVALEPAVIHKPPTPGPGDPFFGLPARYAGLMQVLPLIGIKSLADLAAVEGEDLLHRVRSNPELDRQAFPHPLFGEAILSARAQLGAEKVQGVQQADVSLAEKEEFQRSFLPVAAGKAHFTVQLPESHTSELIITRPGGEVAHRVRGTQSVSVEISEADLASGQPIVLRMVNTSSSAFTGRIKVELPVSAIAGLGAFRLPDVRDNIETVYQAWAAVNPGIDPHVVETSLNPDNIRGWIDMARTFFAHTGVCSIDDLGLFRMQPAGILHTGAYVAPKKPPVSLSDVAVLAHYAFSSIINKSIVYYRPNDTLHDTAVIMAGEWDIRGQTVVIGQEVRELFVIARSIRHDAGSSITWQYYDLPQAPQYIPAKAANGANGSVHGERGHNGEPGDPDPHPARNGGANADIPAPIVTMYLLDASNNLPPIFLGGRFGGTGGAGQDGGDGGDGAQGEPADSHFFSGCCRGVGHGGDGGNGGNSGRGGKGGRGGQGGRMTLLTTEASIAVLAGRPPSVNINPGPGGPGGGSGSTGRPGHGGPAGSADCELWCPEHPEFHGNDGAPGADGGVGRRGEPGPAVLSDALQIYPITEEQWNTAFNQPHILSVTPADVEPGERVFLTGKNFAPGTDKIFFDGVQQSDASVIISNTTSASFTVPLTTEGGTHPIVIRPAGVTSRRSNRVWVRVIPKLDPIPAGTRFTEGQVSSITGLAFAPNCQLVAEDWALPGHPSFNLPVSSNTRTQITFSIPAGPLGAMRGVRRIIVRNPDGGASRTERVARIGDTIVVPVAAFRVLGTTPGIGTNRSAADIASLFTESNPHSISGPWGTARISFQLVQPVGTITVADDNANIWPFQDRPTDRAVLTGAPGVPGALNIFFVRDVQSSTAYAYFGGGPIICGDNAGDLSIEHVTAITAHEVGHTLCLRHVCDGRGEGPGTFFNRTCQSGDEAFLMYPFWNVQTGLGILPGQVDATRIGATHLEEGKTNRLALATMMQAGVPPAIPLCQAVDAE